MTLKSCRVSCIVLSLLLLTAASFAATNPLNNPHGLAVDAAGNLYVANTNGGTGGTGNILVFGPGYALLKTKTITQNINLPSAVAFDPFGGLWVANYASSNTGAYGSIAQYTHGVETAVITAGINGPEAIAIDGMDNLYVNNSLNNLTIYTPPNIYAATSNLVQTIPSSVTLESIAINGNVVTYASGNLIYQVFLLPLVESGTIGGYSFSFGVTPSSIAAGGGIAYMAFTDGTLLDINGASGQPGYLTKLPFAPTAMALDLPRGRLYASSAAGNAIYVYSTSTWALLKTIQ